MASLEKSMADMVRKSVTSPEAISIFSMTTGGFPSSDLAITSISKTLLRKTCSAWWAMLAGGVEWAAGFEPAVGAEEEVAEDPEEEQEDYETDRVAEEQE